MCVVRKVGYKEIERFLDRVDTEGMRFWEMATVCSSTAKALLTMEAFKGCSGHGLFAGSSMIGYAIVQEAHKSLELLYVSPSYRGKGFAADFVKALDVAKTVVHSENLQAIRFYEKLGIEFDYED